MDIRVLVRRVRRAAELLLVGHLRRGIRPLPLRSAVPKLRQYSRVRQRLRLTVISGEERRAPLVFHANRSMTANRRCPGRGRVRR